MQLVQCHPAGEYIRDRHWNCSQTDMLAVNRSVCQVQILQLQTMECERPVVSPLIAQERLTDKE
jgi:hypothetical protein